jgi:hypothetical protein
VKRRERAITLGYYIPKPPPPGKVFLEVPREIRNEAKNMIKGKMLKTTREQQIGHSSRTTRSASLEAFQTNITTKEQFTKDTKIARKQNAANHGTPLKRTMWADTFDNENEDDTPELANKLLKFLEWWTKPTARNQNSLHDNSPSVKEGVCQRQCSALPATVTDSAADPPEAPTPSGPPKNN